MIMPTGIVIKGSGRGDAEKIRPEQIPAEHAEWFKQNLLWKYLALRGQVYVVDNDLTLGDEQRILYALSQPQLTPPDLEVSELLVPFTLKRE